MLVFYFFALIVVWLGWVSFRGGIDYLKFFKSELAKPKSDFAPFCTIFAPCRGMDSDLAENLSALFKQDFPAYEIIFVTDNENDASVPIINSLISAFPRPGGKLIIAGKAENEGQKVHNLRQAVLHASPKSEVFVFVDSDARPGKDWLRNLIAPLTNENIGCATGYRWFLSEKGGFSAELLSAWNASVVSFLGKDQNKNFCWGGSTAIRRADFEPLKVSDHWQGTLSDDFIVMRVMRAAKKGICFVPQCLTASFHDPSFHEMLEFTTRQIKITRVYATNFWLLSFIGAILFNLTFWAGVILLFYATGWHFWLTLAFILATIILGIGKAWIRLDAVKLVLTEYQNQLNRQFFWQNTLWLLTPILYFYNGFAALISRRINWRGITYELKSPTETVIIATNAE